MSADPVLRVGPDPLPDRAAYTVYEARQQLGNISQATAYHLINTGRLRSFKVGRRRFISADAIRDFIQRSESEAAASDAA